MALTDNALGRQQVGFDSPLVPTLRSGFTVGSHFSYHQVEANKPRSFEYATGQVTIALARMLQKALTGQILIGAFQRPVEGATGTLDTVLFLARAEALLTRLKGRAVGEHVIKEIRAILSGGTVDKSSHSVVKYAVTDKHGHAHEAFNLRLKVEPEKAPLIELGLAADELAEFDAKPAVYEIPLAGTERPAAQGGAG
jgi:hypothetical protein